MICIVIATCGLGLATKLFAPTWKATHKNPASGMAEPEMTQRTIDALRSQGPIDKGTREVLENRIKNGIPNISADQRQNLLNQLNALPRQ